MEELRSKLGGRALFILRNEGFAIALEQAIVQRRMSLYERLNKESRKKVADAYAEAYGAISGKIARLREMSQTAKSLRDDLATFYDKPPKEPDQNKPTDAGQVDRSSIVALDATVSKNYTHGLRSRTQPYTVHVTASPAFDQEFSKDKGIITAPQAHNGTEFQDLVNANPVIAQTTWNFDHLPQAVHPKFENTLRELRTQSEIIDELLTHSLAAAKADNISEILRQELRAQNLLVRQAQVTFLSSFLFCPFEGVVTTVYKDVGEAVAAGEPVARVDFNKEILVVGRIQSRTAVKVNAPVEIKCKRVFDSSDEVVLQNGAVAAVRGHDADDDEWDVIFQFKNPGLPINYQMDKDSTVITRLG